MFRRYLFHASMEKIFESIKEFMETPEIIKCGDSHYHKVFYSIGPYIADYPEQVLVTCIVQGWCPQ